jgi:hypothetical protein
LGLPIGGVSLHHGTPVLSLVGFSGTSIRSVRHAAQGAMLLVYSTGASLADTCAVLHEGRNQSANTDDV